LRGSRTVLREAVGEVPTVYSPIVFMRPDKNHPTNKKYLNELTIIQVLYVNNIKIKTSTTISTQYVDDVRSFFIRI
jgi:hypothetical protein